MEEQKIKLQSARSMCRNHFIFLSEYTVGSVAHTNFVTKKIGWNVTVQDRNAANVLHWPEDEKSSESGLFLTVEKNKPTKIIVAEVLAKAFMKQRSSYLIFFIIIYLDQGINTMFSFSFCMCS